MKEKDITIWRFNLHTHNGSEEQMKVFEYCELNKIIGTGWRTNIRLMDSKKDHISDDEFYNRLNKFDFPNQKSFKNSMKCLKKMKKDDLIWTRKNNIYYICRVTGKAKDFMIGDRSKKIEYEYILFKRDNPREKAKIQVKTSNINIDSYNLGDMPFYFFTTGNYWKDGKIINGKELMNFAKKNKVEIISKEEILDFAKENERFLPYRLKWI